MFFVLFRLDWTHQTPYFSKPQEAKLHSGHSEHPGYSIGQEGPCWKHPCSSLLGLFGYYFDCWPLECLAPWNWRALGYRRLRKGHWNSWRCSSYWWSSGFANLGSGLACLGSFGGSCSQIVNEMSLPFDFATVECSMASWESTIEAEWLGCWKCSSNVVDSPALLLSLY